MTSHCRVVFIAQRVNELEAATEYYGHCEVEENGTWTMIEGPGWNNPEDAVAWGREQATVVLIRVGSQPPQQYYSAGEVLPTGEGSDEILPWPPPSA